MNDGKWYGVDPVSMLLGGQAGKLKTFTAALNKLSSAIKVVNQIEGIINGAIDDTVRKIRSAVDPVKATVQSGITYMENAIEDIKGSSVYFLDLNTVNPAMYMYGETFKEASYKLQLDSLRKEVEEIENHLKYTDEEKSLLKRKKYKEIEKKIAQIESIRKTTGGTKKYYDTFVKSLDDKYDISRPQFSDDATIVALFVMFGATNLGQFLDKMQKFSEMISSVSELTAPNDMVPPLKNLTIKYTASSDMDAEYIELRNYWEAISKAYHGSSSTGPHLGLIKINRELEKNPEYIPIDLEETAVKFNFKALRSKDIETQIGNYSDINTDKYRYILIGHKDKLSSLQEKLKIPLEFVSANFFHMNGTLFFRGIAPAYESFYAPDSQISDSLISSGGFFQSLFGDGNMRIYDPNNQDLATGNAPLYWDYPEISGFLRKFLSQTEVSFNEIMVYKKEITTKKRNKTLAEAILHNSPVIKNEKEGIFVEPIMGCDGLRKFYTDSIPTIKEAREHVDSEGNEDPILKYEYAVSSNYTIRHIIPFGIEKGKDIFSKTENVIERLPVVVAIPKDYESYPEIQKRKEYLELERIRILDRIRKKAEESSRENRIAKKEKEITSTKEKQENLKTRKSENETKLSESNKLIEQYRISRNIIGDKLESVGDSSSDRENLNSLLDDIDNSLEEEKDISSSLEDSISEDTKKIKNYDSEIKSIEEDIKNIEKEGLSAWEKLYNKETEDGTNLNLSIITPKMSNVAYVDMPTEFYPQPSSIPPDWKSFPHLTMVIPKVFQFLDATAAWLTSLANSVLDATDLIPQLQAELHKDIAAATAFINELLDTVSKTIEALSKLSFGAWILPVYISTGGLTAIKNHLAFSLTQKLEDIKLNPNDYLPVGFKGSPPYGPEDYVGGFVLLAGTTGAFSDIYGILKPSPTIPLASTKPEDFDSAAQAEEETAPPLPLPERDTLNQQEKVDASYMMSYASDAIESLNANNSSRLAADLASIFSLPLFKGTGIYDASLGTAIEIIDALSGEVSKGIPDSIKNLFSDAANYLDPEAYDNEGYIKFIQALKDLDPDLMESAALILLETGFSFRDDEFFLLIGNALSTLLAYLLNKLGDLNISIPFPEIDPFAFIEDLDKEIPHDVYQVGWNIAVYSEYDSRLLNTFGYNDELESVIKNDELEIILYEDNQYDLQSAIDEWEVFQYSEIFTS